MKVNSSKGPIEAVVVVDQSGNSAAMDSTGRTQVNPLGIPAAAKQLAATTTTGASTALTSTTVRLSMTARKADCRYMIGTGSQTSNASNSHFIAQGERLDISCAAGSQISVIRDSGATVDGVVEITELA